MYNLLLSLAAALVVGVVTWLAGFPWYAGIFPAVLIGGGALFLLARRTGQQVQARLAVLPGMMQDLSSMSDPKQAKQRLAEVRTLLEEVRDTYGPWQLLLAGQLDAQIGMLDYMQLEFDAALPRLQKSFRDATALTAVGCIHYRRDDLDAAWKAFDDAAKAQPKDVHTYLVHATLKVRKGLRREAIEVLAAGLEALPDHQLLKRAKNAVANKKPIDTKAFEEVWFRYFPEDAAKQMMVRGRRGNPADQGMVRMQQGPPQPKLRGKLARRR